MSDPATPESPSPQAATPPPAPRATLADQYEVGDATPAESAGQATSASAEPGPGFPAPPGPAPPARDPETGRYVKPTSPKYLTQMAKEAGLSDAEIAEADPEVLAQTVYHLRRREASVQQAMLDALEPSQPAPAGQEQPPAPEVGDLGLDQERFDPDLVAVFQKQADRIKQLEAQLGQVTRHVQAQANQTTTQRCDAWFAKNEARYGKGTRGDLKDGSVELDRRLLLLERAKKIKAGSVEEALDKAHEIIYGAAPAAPPAPAAKGPSAADWKQGVLAKPTQRSGAGEPPGEAKARQTVQTFLDQQVQQAPDLADEFPV